MKFIAIVAGMFLAVSLTSCGFGSSKSESSDSLVVDTVTLTDSVYVADSVNVDSTLVDSVAR